MQCKFAFFNLPHRLTPKTGKEDNTYTYYQDDGNDPRKVFLARYDWLVRNYLPADKSYNIPLIIAGILLIIGIYYLADDKPKKKSAGLPERQSEDKNV